jgi:6-phosphogluconolactonase
VLNVFASEEKVLTAVADLIVTKAHEAIAQRERFNIALSGGGSPKRLYEMLASGEYRNKIEWRKVFFFFGDERYVPLTDANSNFLMVKTALFEPLSIHDANVFAVNTALTPKEAAHEYERRLLNHFGDARCRFDLILLGLGDDSHTASLFPFTSVLQEQKALVKEVFVDKANMVRITFTPPLINAGRIIVFLLYGATKADAVYNILKGEENMTAYPAQLVRPEDGELLWFMDEAAAGRVLLV